MALAFAGCQRQVQPSAETAYKNARRALQLGELDLATKSSDEAALKYSSQSTEWACQFRVLKAQVLVSRGLSRDALALLNEEPPSSIQGKEPAVRWQMVRGLAQAFSGQMDAAETSLNLAAQAANASQPKLLGEIALATGILHVMRGEYVDARGEFGKALRISRQEAQLFLEANALGSLGNVSMKQERYDEAVSWYKAAYELSQSLGAKHTSAKTLGNMGWSYLAIGDLENALTLFEQAEDSSARIGLWQDQVYWRNNIGLVYYSRHEYESADGAFERALDLARKLGDNGSTFDALNNLALVCLARSEATLALQYNHEASELARRTKDRARELESLQTTGLIESDKRNYAEAKTIFQKVIRDPAAETPLRWQAQGGLAGVFAAEGLADQAKQEFQQATATIEKARSSLQHEEFRLSFLTSAIDLYDDYVKFLVSRKKTLDALEVAELSRARTLLEGLDVGSSKAAYRFKAFQPKKTARALGATILSYWLSAKNSYLWAITPSGEIEFYMLPPAKDIEALVQVYVDALVGPRDVLEANNAAGQKLFEILIAPVEKLIGANTRVVIVPDGALYRLNFEALLAAKPHLHYWIEDVAVTNTSSLLLLGRARDTPRNATRKLLLIGAPVSVSSEFPFLPQAAPEMERVENYFPPEDRRVITGPAATASAYLGADPGQYSFLHFVTHGTASRLSPLDSAIILSPQREEYKLYGRDIIQKPLHANLVIISACNGAGTRTYSGEGLVGLSWAFLRAGAHNVIAALWEVSDASTPQLMDKLYAELRQGRDPAVALRQAKLALLRSRSVYRKPFYWAPFQLYAGW